LDENKIEKEGVDPDIVELTPQSYGMSYYDSRNEIVSKRRSTIKTSLTALRLNLGDLDDDTKTTDESKIDEKKFESVLHTIRGNAEEENTLPKL
jgi:hypothetical protein